MSDPLSSMSDEDNLLSSEEDQPEEDPDNELEENTYTYAFVNSVRTDLSFGAGFIYPMVLLVLSATSANILAYSVLTHSYHDSAREESFISTIEKDTIRYALYGGQQRLATSKAELVCGHFYRSRLRTSSHSIFTYEKHPSNDWDPSSFFGDSMLDESLTIQELSTEFPQNFEFVLIFFLWALEICREGKGIYNFWLVLAGMMKPVSQRILGNRTNTESLTCRAIFVGCAVIVVRFATCIFVAYVGSVFLINTTSKVDLILNALALGFILQMDDVVYMVCVSRKAETTRWVKKILAITGDSSKKNSTNLGGPLSLVFCLAVSVLAIFYVSRQSREDVASLAAICLFMGPSPRESLADRRLAAVFPVPGICESLLSTSCKVSTLCLDAYTEGALPDECLVYGPDFNCTSANEPIDFGNIMIQKMQHICERMWQPTPQIVGSDGVLRSASHNRETDTSEDEMAFASPFWCSFGQDSAAPGEGVGQFFNDVDLGDLDNAHARFSSVFYDDTMSALNHCSGPLRWRNLTSYPSAGSLPDEQQV